MNNDVKQDQMMMVSALKPLTKTNKAELDKPIMVIVDESGIYVDPHTGLVYMGGELVESKPQEVIYLGYTE